MVEEQTLVWAAHQVERWARRLALERGEGLSPGIRYSLICELPWSIWTKLSLRGTTQCRGVLRIRWHGCLTAEYPSWRGKVALSGSST